MGFRMKQEKSWDFGKPIPSSVFCELGKLSVSTEKNIGKPGCSLAAEWVSGRTTEVMQGIFKQVNKGKRSGKCCRQREAPPRFL